MKAKKKIILTSLVSVLLAISVYQIFYSAKSQPPKIEEEIEEVIKEPETKKEEPKKPEIIIKESALLNVPYTVQAPFANWTVHQESCEEAAVLMYHYFLINKVSFDGKTVIPQQSASDEMVKMKKWQELHYGKEPDLTIEQLGKFMKEYYGHDFEVSKNITKEEIKREISKGRPVLVPVMTHSLKNPHYGARNSYHVLLIKGYSPEGVTTNDAGIREGENYFYTWDTIFSAMDAQSQSMKQGREMLVL